MRFRLRLEIGLRYFSISVSRLDEYGFAVSNWRWDSV